MIDARTLTTRLPLPFWVCCVCFTPQGRSRASSEPSPDQYTNFSSLGPQEDSEDGDFDGWAAFMEAVEGRRPPPAKAYGLAAIADRDSIANVTGQPVRLAAMAQLQSGAMAGSIGLPVGPSTPFHDYLACADGPAYRFEKKLADSLMGTVWLAIECDYDETAKALVDRVPSQRVVIKRSFVQLIQKRVDKDGRRVREDPLHEVRVLKYLSGKHPRLTSLLGAYTDPRTPEEGVPANEREMFLVMEFCSGGDLFDYITATEGRAERRFPEDLIRRLFTDMCSAVVAMHGWGIIHRDLSPENILLDDNQRAKVCDPGQAIDRWAMGCGPMPADSDILGKTHFRAPELARRLPHDEKVDVYSLGMILFLLFFLGMRPPAPDRIERGRLFEDAERYGRRNWASPEAQDLMLRMTATNPAHRFSMLQVLGHPWMAEAAVFLGFPSQEAMVAGATTNLKAGENVCKGLEQFRRQAAGSSSPSSRAGTDSVLSLPASSTVMAQVPSSAAAPAGSSSSFPAATAVAPQQRYISTAGVPHVAADGYHSSSSSAMPSAHAAAGGDAHARGLAEPMLGGSILDDDDDIEGFSG